MEATGAGDSIIIGLLFHDFPMMVEEFAGMDMWDLVTHS